MLPLPLLGSPRRQRSRCPSAERLIVALSPAEAIFEDRSGAKRIGGCCRRRCSSRCPCCRHSSPCCRTTTAPHCNPNGHPHCPRPIRLCRGGGRSKVSIFSAEKRKPIKNVHSPVVGVVLDAERAAVASATSGARPPPPLTTSSPQRGLLLHNNGRRAGAAARGARRLPHDAGGASASDGHSITVAATEEDKK